MDKLWYLANFEIFAGIEEGEIMKLATDITACNLAKGELLYCPGDIVDKLYLLKRGEVKFYHSHEGKRQTFEILGPNSVFGAMGFEVDSKPVGHFAEAMTATMICALSMADFRRIMMTHPEIVPKLLVNFSQRLTSLEQRLDTRNHNAETIIWRELVKIANLRSKSLFDKLTNRVNKIYLTHDELAEITGLNRVTVSRTLKKLRKSGKLETGNGYIRLLI